jgi:peroxiredoxin
VIVIWIIVTLQFAHAEAKEYMALSDFGVAVGDIFPLDSLEDPNGEALPAERILGKAVLISFYTEYCPPCIREVPKLNQVLENRNDINVLAITPDSHDEAAKYVKRYGLNWPVASNANELLSERLNVEAFPGFALLDSKGMLLATVYANQLGGDDGHATVEGIETWVNFHVGKAAE